MLRRTVFLLALVVVLVLMLRPVQEVSSSSDKLDHAMVFAALAVVGTWARVEPWRLVVGLAVYGALTEVLQSVATTRRQGDPLDFVADLVGILVIAVVVLVVRRARAASIGPARPRG